MSDKPQSNTMLSVRGPLEREPVLSVQALKLEKGVERLVCGSHRESIIQPGCS